MSTTSTATTTDTRSRALHVADRRDLIRVHGARMNGLTSEITVLDEAISDHGFLTPTA